jgi:hypothetical protein
MPGTWPMLDALELETRVRTYINETTASFFTQAEIRRWLSLGAKDIAQNALCVRRILDANTVAATRNVAANAYKVLHVEYVPSSGRARMLTKIDPLRVGNYVSNGVEPQYWYEYGSNIGIEPLPDAMYQLRLYVADLPKMQHYFFPITSWLAEWNGSGTGTWTNGVTAAYVGATGENGINTYGTAIAASTTYTFTVTVSGISNCSLIITVGGTPSKNITTNGVHTVTLTSGVTTALTLTATMTGATGGVTVDDLYILKEQDFTADGDQTELAPAWQHLLVLYAVSKALYKDRRGGPATMIASIYNNELAYLRQSIVEVIPDGRSSLKFQ